jgi:hypothetical protein
MNLFEQATRMKLRWATSKGQLSVEQLWDLPMTSSRGSLSIEEIGKAAVKAVRDSEATDGFSVGPSVSTADTLRLKILEHIRDRKAEAAAGVAKRRNNAEKKKKLLELLEKKQDNTLLGLSEKELLAQIEALDE